MRMYVCVKMSTCLSHTHSLDAFIIHSSPRFDKYSILVFIWALCVCVFYQYHSSLSPGDDPVLPSQRVPLCSPAVGASAGVLHHVRNRHPQTLQVLCRHHGDLSEPKIYTTIILFYCCFFFFM